MIGQDNRVLAHEERVQRAIDSGQKADGTGPVGDLKALEQSLNLTAIEVVAYQNAQARAHVMGVLSTAEAQIVYQSISEGSATGWVPGTTLARKVTITNLIGQLMGMGR